MTLVLFVRVGWMRWYRGPRPDDGKPVGGGKYTKASLGGEAFNFLPLNGEMLGYFQPMLPTTSARKTHPSHVALERILPGFRGDSLSNVLAVFVATHPKLGRQRVIGWYPSATVYRYAQRSTLKERRSFSYFLRAPEKYAVLVPEPGDCRNQYIPAGRGGFGQANVCYALDSKGKPKQRAGWIEEALAYIGSYDRENAVRDPVSETDADIAGTIAGRIEQAAGFQSNPRIRKAIELYAMRRAQKYLERLKYNPKDTHRNKPYDFVCDIDGVEVFVEVKGTQGSGEAISLTPREVMHAQTHSNSALFVVHSVVVRGKRSPVVSAGRSVFLYPWDISRGTLKPRGYILTLPGSI